MKKKLLLAAFLVVMLISTSVVFAAPIQLSGDMQFLTQKNEHGDTFSNVRLRLNADVQLEDNMYIHGRIMGIDMSPSNYNKAGTGSSGASVNMEQLFLGAKLGAVDVKLGRQPLDIGQGMLADVNGIQGVSLATSTPGMDFYGFVGRSNEEVYLNTGGVKESGPRDTVGLKIGTRISKINLGAGYLSTKDTDATYEKNNYMSFNADSNLSEKVNLGAVFMKNTESKADGYIVKATIGQTAKKGDINYVVSYRNIEDTAVDSDWVTNGAYANSKGVRFTVNYKPTNNSTLTLYKDITKQQNDDSVKPNQMRAEWNINF